MIIAIRNTLESLLLFVWGGGAIRSSPQDLLRLMEYLLGSYIYSRLNRKNGTTVETIGRQKGTVVPRR